MHTKDSSPVLPDAHSDLNKKAQVADMFDRIAGKYDFLNHFLSMGIDKGWRRKAIKEIARIQPQKILDVATGTGDLAIAALQTKPQQIIGIDISEGMLEIGKKKIEALHASQIIQLEKGDSEALSFETGSFDAITCAYGVRNFENLEKGLTEMCRVMKPGGRLAILEFSHPKTFPVKQLYEFYFRFILPALGKIVSKHNSAYTYLPESVKAFPDGRQFCEILKQCGFTNPKAQPLTFGITSLYTATKS